MENVKNLTVSEKLDKLTEILNEDGFNEASVRMVRRKRVKASDRSKRRRYARSHKSQIRRSRKKYKRTAGFRKKERIRKVLFKKKKVRRGYKRMIR